MGNQAVYVTDPFKPGGREAKWHIFDMERQQVVSIEMDHFDAMRKNVDHRFEAVVRSDRLAADMVFATLHDSKFLMAPSSVDISGALESMSINDFVELQGHAFKGEEISSRLLSLLVDHGDPRAERLDTYVRETATPDVDGNRPFANIKMRESDVMHWLERNRPEIHEELAYRAELGQASFHV